MDKLDIAVRALEKVYSNASDTDLIIDTVHAALEAIRLYENDWTTNIMHNPPPNERLVLIKCDDWSGEYTMVAMRQDYKKPAKGQSKKGFKQGWRWIGPNGKTLTRKELPSAWKYL